MVNQTIVEGRILSLLDDMATRLDDPTKARQDHARELASIICEAITSAEAIGTVTVAGSASTQTGTVKIPIK
jgi:hypothetical protein